MAIGHIWPVKLPPPMVRTRSSGPTKPLGRRGDHHASQHHHRGMAEGEEQPGIARLLPDRHQLAHHIVDGGDVVGE